MHHFVRYFIRGLIVVVPVALTAWVLYQVFAWIDSLVLFPVPGIGFLLTIASIVAIGFLASNFVTRKIFDAIEAIFSRAPIARILYVSIRDLVEAFVGDRKKFNQPVLVELTGQVRAVGFLTRDDLSLLGIRDHVAVYFPQSYNFAGNLLIVPVTSIQPIAADASRVMGFVVSGGVSEV